MGLLSSRMKRIRKNYDKEVTEEVPTSSGGDENGKVGEKKPYFNANISSGDDDDSCQSSAKLRRRDDDYNLDQKEEDFLGTNNNDFQPNSIVPANLTTHLNINTLPRSILIQVFSYLSLRSRVKVACLVCRHWQKLCFDADLWRKVSFSGFPLVQDETLIRLTGISSNITSLNITDCIHISNEALEKVAAVCTNLCRFTSMRCSQLADDAFVKLAQNCSKLQHMNLTHCIKLTDLGLGGIARNSPLLSQLFLNGCHLVTDVSIATVSDCCQSLKEINLSNLNKLTDKSLMSIASGCKHLEVISLCRSGFTGDGVIELAKLSQLKNLDLSSSGGVTPAAVQVVAEKCTNLSMLSLNLCSLINDKCVFHIACHAKNLTHLFLVSCHISDKALIALGTHSKQIQHVDISWCKNITAIGVQEISESCPTLTFLGLVRCDQISHSFVEDLLEKHPNIHYSTVLLDYKRLIDKVREKGFILEGV